MKATSHQRLGVTSLTHTKSLTQQHHWGRATFPRRLGVALLALGVHPLLGPAVLRPADGLSPSFTFTVCFAPPIGLPQHVVRPP